jgi:hypothetical protein
VSEDAAVYRVDGMAVSLAPRGDALDWARALVSAFVRGERRSPTVYRMAHDALGLPVPAGLRS